MKEYSDQLVLSRGGKGVILTTPTTPSPSLPQIDRPLEVITTHGSSGTGQGRYTSREGGGVKAYRDQLVLSKGGKGAVGSWGGSCKHIYSQITKIPPSFPPHPISRFPSLPVSYPEVYHHPCPGHVSKGRGSDGEGGEVGLTRGGVTNWSHEGRGGRATLDSLDQLVRSKRVVGDLPPSPSQGKTTFTLLP